MTPDTDSLRDFIQDQIQGLGEVEFRHMFGGYGLYRGDVFFGILYKDRLYFRTDQASRQAYVDRGMRPFRPSVKQTLKNYYEVPPDIVEDSEALVAWVTPGTLFHLTISITFVFIHVSKKCGFSSR